MIPKIIHYCWFGKGEKSKLLQNCIASWREFLPNYRIIEWNEENFNIENALPYVKEAYERKKYAFVSDYVRLYALEKYGGIYLDTDVEVKKTLDSFLKYSVVFCFESDNRVATAVMLAEQGNKLIKQWKDTYDIRHFISSQGVIDMTPNVKELTDLLKTLGIILNGNRQEISSLNLLVCEKETFCPYAIGESRNQSFSSSYTIHWCDGSWVSGSVWVKHKVIILIKKMIGSHKYEIIRKKIKGI
ncbi:glycosyl transferase [Aminipila butyrica]|uniref:Glycosyl transferase n=1 Tax=Aminipila butyrica TaxID=433296 RepID=A0A858BW25_9FIRM|nr:glycosyltransferase [Aminipila butyrica]QIB69110.1 glycosyl transferase [Aminipila butyrica]